MFNETLDLKEWSVKLGISEFELAKYAFKFKAIMAEYTGEPQRVLITCKEYPKDKREIEMYTINVNLDDKCKRCGKGGATQGGYCMACVAKMVREGKFDHIIKKHKRQ